MARIYPTIFLGDRLLNSEQATLHIASSAVLYGLSVYTVFNVSFKDGAYNAFRLKDHYRRLTDSCRIIGITTFEGEWPEEKFTAAVKELIHANNPATSVFIRASVHVDELVPGTRSRGLHSSLSLFVYEATPIVPQDGARLKTSVWRRIPDYAIPSRAKVNGAYVNSVLAKQDAIDSGYDDCIFLDSHGHVCELSAANIFLVRSGVLITPDATSDLLEGINRRSIIELARDNGIKVEERTVDLTELYIADEVFMSGTSAFVAPVAEIDARVIGGGSIGPLTNRLRKLHSAHLDTHTDKGWLTTL
ncbi:MAG TPA: aminotransferase class IV [Candidatus Nitrosotenuis sp.]|nr:aminotransferase class IV [Candidatus Nitrosotenuis sp.]